MPVPPSKKPTPTGLAPLETLGTATVSSQRKISLPKRVYDLLELKQGDTIAFVLNENEEIEVHKVLFYRREKGT